MKEKEWGTNALKITEKLFVGTDFWLQLISKLTWVKKEFNAIEYHSWATWRTGTKKWSTIYNLGDPSLHFQPLSLSVVLHVH